MNKQYLFIILYCLSSINLQITCSSNNTELQVAEHLKPYVFSAPSEKPPITVNHLGQNSLHQATRATVISAYFLHLLCQYPELINAKTQQDYRNKNYQDTIGTLSTFHEQWDKLIVWVSRGGNPHLTNASGKNAYNNCPAESQQNAFNAIQEGFLLLYIRNFHRLNHINKYEFIKQQHRTPPASLSPDTFMVSNNQHFQEFK